MFSSIYQKFRKYLMIFFLIFLFINVYNLILFSAFWAFAFFFMLVLVGIDSQFVGVEGFVVAITGKLFMTSVLRILQLTISRILCFHRYANN